MEQSISTPFTAERFITLAMELGATETPSKILDHVLDFFIEQTGAERGFVMDFQSDRGFQVQSARCFDRQDLIQTARELSGTLLRLAQRQRSPWVVPDVACDQDLAEAASLRAQSRRSLMVVPLRAREQKMGIAVLDHGEAGHFVGCEDHWIEAIATLTAVCLVHARRIRDLGSALERAEVQSADRAEALGRTVRELARVRSRLNESGGDEDMVGQSPAFRLALEQIERASQVDYPVFLFGESGTGKELAARRLHERSSRHEHPFVVADCGAIPSNLLASELFGCVKGAFTGADRDREGLFRAADKGTLFLDEVENMPREMQESLLRVLQDGSVRPVGASHTAPVDVRLIAASNVDLGELVNRGKFREDLYYRMHVISISLPPLNDRREDIPLLIERMLRNIREEIRRDIRIDPEAVKELVAAPWPGNIRQLENVLRSTAAMSDGVIHARDVVRLVAEAPVSKTDRPGLMSLDVYLRWAIETFGHQMTDSELATQLGISRKTLWKNRKEWGLDRI